MKKKLLFAIHKLGAGGAEKSLATLLQCVPLDDYDVTLLAFDPSGIFRSQIPENVKVVGGPDDVVCEGAKILSPVFWRHCNLRLLYIKIRCILGNKLRSKASWKRKCHGQYYNEVWKNRIKDFDGEYDIAISYMDGVNYYVIDHVNAKRKILWCHNDYNKLDYLPSYDLTYYEKAEKVFTISEVCCQSLRDNFPSIREKFDVIENISSATMINSQAADVSELLASNDGFNNDSRFKVVSIGRLTDQKGFDMAVEAAKILQNKGIKFCWYILGEGELRGKLEQMVADKGVSDCIKFIGIRSNPYPYMKGADLFAMTSRYEGKSIALDEAKILAKPIVVTNYPSVSDAIENGVTGLIVNMDSVAIADGIETLYRDKDARKKLSSFLLSKDWSNEKPVVDKFMKVLKNKA